MKQYLTAQGLLEDAFRLGAEILNSGFRPTFIIAVWRGGAPVGIAVQEDNTVACCFEPTDLNTFMEVLESPESAEAMGTDGVKRDTVKLYVIDREFQP